MCTVHSVCRKVFFRGLTGFKFSLWNLECCHILLWLCVKSEIFFKGFCVMCVLTAITLGMTCTYGIMSEAWHLSFPFLYYFKLYLQLISRLFLYVWTPLMHENIELKQRNLFWRWCACHWKPNIIGAGRYTSAWSWLFAQQMVGNKEELLWLCVSIGASTTLEACCNIVDVGNERVEFHTLAILITNPLSKFTCFVFLLFES